MKIKEWIILGCVVFFASGISALAAEGPKKETVAELIDQIDHTAQSLVSEEAPQSILKPVYDLQNAVYRAMALDPSVLGAVPPSQVPKHLFSDQLNQDLQEKINEIKKSSLMEESRLQPELNDYLSLVQKIIDLRKVRQFPFSRSFAKRGHLDERFGLVTHKLGEPKENGANPLHDAAQTSTHLKTLIDNLRTQVTASPKESPRKELLPNGNQFFLYVIIIIMGFLLGIGTYRIHPDFFQKFLTETQTMAAPPKVRESQKLDYMSWLRELEEILSRLKSSQQTHERRIEDVVQNSEKITQQAMALYSDARIKSEANLEFRMSALIKEIQAQSEQGKRLQLSDRVQINLILEHYLLLCDAIETDGIRIDPTQRADSGRGIERNH